MSTTDEAAKKWSNIGESISSLISNKKRKDVKVDDYYVVVGFEVNKPEAFVGDVHDLAVDYGHAFFYIVKNLLVEKVFSFGPAGAGKVGWGGLGSNENPNWANTGALLKDGYQNSRPGTADYGITELVTAFKVTIDHATGLKVVKKTEEMRQKIVNGMRYVAYLNDTCADIARDVLQSAGVKTPEGSGFVKHSGMGIATGTDIDVPLLGNKKIGFSHVNPYMWHKNFKAGAFASATYAPPIDPATGGQWKPTVGSSDPIF
jgi:hypothetical protein